MLYYSSLINVIKNTINLFGLNLDKLTLEFRLNNFMRNITYVYNMYVCDNINYLNVTWLF